MAIAHILGSTTNNGITATTSAVSFSISGASAGQFFICAFSTNSSSITITNTDSCTLRSGPDASSLNNMETWIYSKFLVSGDITRGTIRFTLSAAGRPIGTASVFSGVDTTTPVETIGTPVKVEAAASSGVNPTLSSVSANGMLWSAYGLRVASATNQTPGLPTGYSASALAAQAFTTSPNYSSRAVYKATTTVGSYGNNSSTYTGSSSNAIHNAVILKALPTNTTPTIAPNTADLTAFVTATPTLEFTGSDTDSDDLQYEIQIDTVNTFNSTGGLATPALVQSVKVTNASATPAAAALTSVGAGELITVQTAQPSATAGIVTGVTDTSGNSYAKSAERAGTGTAATLWFAYNAAAGNPTVNVAFNDAANDISVIVRHWSGVQSASLPTDGVATNSGSGTAVTNGVDVTPTANNALIVSGMSMATGTGTITSNAPYTNGDSIINATSGSVGVQSTIGSSGGAYDGTFTLSSSQAWALVVAGFKANNTAAPLIDKLSASDPGFLDVPNNADTQPFTAGNKVSYTVQSSLSAGTYYWRARVIDPSGTNTYSSYTTTRSFTVTLGSTITKTQPAAARIANTNNLTQPATARVATNPTKTQPSIARISNIRTATQPTIARIARNPTKTQPATARIVNTGMVKTQAAIARIATNRALTQGAISRISNTRSLTQPAVARVSQTYTKTQGATAHIAPTVTKTQPATARVATNRTKTQPGISRISNTGTKTQPSVSRIATNRTLTQTATASIVQNLTPTKTQGAIARIATNRALTQGAISRVANTRTKTQSAISRISQTYTLTQPAGARIQKTVSKTQSAVGRIATSRNLTQPASARISQGYTKLQTGTSRISNTRTLTQPTIARVATNRTLTQPATARILNTGVVKTQGAIARIANNRSNTQGAISRISNTRTLTQPAVARIAKNVTKTQSATARIATSVAKTQPAISRIANNRALTQPAISRISRIVTKTQPVISRIANVRTKTQSATASTTVNGLNTKNQPATGRISVNRSLTQSGLSRIANRQSFTQTSRAYIAASRTKTQPATARISRTFSKTQSATASIIQRYSKTQSATAHIYQTAIIERTTALTLTAPAPIALTLQQQTSAITGKLPSVTSLTLNQPPPLSLTVKQQQDSLSVVQKSTAISARLQTTTSLAGTL